MGSYEFHRDTNNIHQPLPTPHPPFKEINNDRSLNVDDLIQIVLTELSPVDKPMKKTSWLSRSDTSTLRAIRMLSLWW